MFRKNMFLTKNNGFVQKICVFRLSAVVLYRPINFPLHFNETISRNFTTITSNLKGNPSNLCNFCIKKRHYSTSPSENFILARSTRYLSQMSPRLNLSDRLRRIRNPEEFTNVNCNEATPRISRQFLVNINRILGQSKRESSELSTELQNRRLHQAAPIAIDSKLVININNFRTSTKPVSANRNFEHNSVSIYSQCCCSETTRPPEFLPNFLMQKRNCSTNITRRKSAKAVAPPPKIEEQSDTGKEITQKDIDHAKNLFPTPKNVLHNVFEQVSRELNDISLRLEPSYHAVKEKKSSSSWCCTYNLKWPTSMKFAMVARTKQEASRKAALSALTWLKSNEKITKEGQPIMLDKAELKTLIQGVAEPLTLDSYAMDRIRDINETYKTMLLPHIYNTLADKENNNTAAAVEGLDSEVDNVHRDEIRLRRNSKPKFLGADSYLAKEKVTLPIAAYKAEFIKLLLDNPVVIVKGEPGCGKSTRIPQYVLESWVTNMQAPDELCRIAVTQPRRIAAISLAERVANERDELTGNIVGYQVRLKSNFKPPTGRILYCTTGILLRHLQSDSTLSTFSHVILDEAHERDVNTDLLMNLLRSTMKVNPKLKLVVMSATIDTGMFQRYFDNAPILHVPGFTHPVRPHFLDEVTKIDLSKTRKMCETPSPSVVAEDVVKVIQFIHKNRKEGAILCFLPGWEDMSKVRKLLPTFGDMTVLCLHSRLQDSEQWKIFSQPPPGVRKVILATNIAETSVTIDDVVYVIDTGIHKENRFDSEKGVNCIDNHWISQSSMIQRKGRAGRVQPGESFHLYPKQKFESFSKFTDPEILRTSLTKILLDSKVYSNNMDALKFMSQLPCPPEETATLRAVKELKDLELLDDDEKLTSLGKVLANFQLEPKLAKALVNAVVYKCVTPIVDIVTLFSAETELFQTGLIDKEGVKRIKTQFCDNSDHLALMRIFEKFLEIYESGDERGIRNFCSSTNVVFHKLQTIEKLRKIHFEYLFKGLHDALPISDNNSDNDELVKAVLLSGVGTLLQHRNWDFVKGRCKKASIFVTNNNHKATITPESVNFKKRNLPLQHLIYINETRSNIRRTTLIRESSAISPIAVLLFTNRKLELKETNDEKMVLALKDSKVQFVGPKEQVMEVVKCKEALNSIYQYYIFQMTEGGEFDSKINGNWDKILTNLSVILTKHAVH